jgi:hypothetical protein
MAIGRALSAAMSDTFNTRKVGDPKIAGPSALRREPFAPCDALTLDFREMR